MKNSTTISFTGDVLFDNYFKENRKSEEFIDNKIISFLNSSDYCICNLEGPILTSASKVDEFIHCSSPYCVDVLKNLNIKVWSIANNHIFDFGEKGIKETLEIANSNECTCFGLKSSSAVSPYYIIDDCGGIGIFSVSYDSRYSSSYSSIHWKDISKIQDAVNSIKKRCRWCIILVHSGEEFSSLPFPEIKNVYKTYIDLGVDIVVGHHPHVVQNYELFKNSIIFYSLGNFIFDTDYQRIQNRTDYGVILKIMFNNNKFTWTVLGTRINRGEEKSCIEADKVVDIFVDIQDPQYNRLLKYSIRSYSNSRKKIDMYFNQQKYSILKSIRWPLVEIKRAISNPKLMWLIVNKYLSYISLNPVADKKIIEYILKS